MPFVYILRCRDGSLYTGAAKDIVRRLDAHRAGTASKFTRSRRPVALAWSRRVRTWRRALELERRIKRLARAEKLALVTGSRLGASRRQSRVRANPSQDPSGGVGPKSTN